MLDYQGAIMAIHRLVDTYQFNIEDILIGKLGNTTNRSYRKMNGKLLKDDLITKFNL